MKSTSLQLTLRTWLFLLTLVTVLPITWFAVSILLELSSKSREETLVRLESRTSDVASKLDTLLQSSMSALNTLGQADAAQNGDVPALYESAKRVLPTNPAFRAISLIDAQGQMLFVTSATYKAATFPVSYEHLVQEVFQTGRPNVSGPFVTPISDNKLVAVSVPVRRNGTITHVLRMIILAETVSQLLTQSGLPEGWLTAVVDRDGVLLARNVNPAKYVGKRATPSFLDAMERKERFLFPTVSLDGAPIMTVIVPLHNADWFLGVAVPDALLNAPSQENLNGFIFVGAVGLILSLMMSQWMARFLSKETTSVARALASTDPSADQLKLHVKDLTRILKAHLVTRGSEAEARQQVQGISQRLDAAENWFDQAPCGYHSLDGQGRIVNMNQTGLRWLGCTLAEVQGRHMSEFFSENSRQAFAECYAALPQKGHINDMELELISRDGAVRTVLIAANSVKDGSGQMIGIRSTLFDITKRKQFEKALVETHAQVQARRDFLEKAVQASAPQLPDRHKEG